MKGSGWIPAFPPQSTADPLRFLAGAGMTICLFTVIAHASSSALFDEANAKYQARDYKAAAGMYSDLINQGESSAALYYNLGNAEFRLGHKGRALLAYERSLQISARDIDTRWNRDVVKSVLTDRLETSEDSLWVYWLKKGSAWVTLNEVSLAFGGVFLLLFLQVLLAFIFPKIGRALRAPRVLTLILTAALLFFGLFKWVGEKDPNAVILDKEAFARYGPSETETKAFLLHEGALVKVSDQSRDWLYITLNNKNSGWIRKESCELV